MNNLNEDKLQPIVIDFAEMRSRDLKEFSYYSMMGSWVKMIIDNMFGTARDYGLDNPRTYKSKSKLKNAVTAFEKATGLKWPFK